jgi:hypothetical protein
MESGTRTPPTYGKLVLPRRIHSLQMYILQWLELFVELPTSIEVGNTEENTSLDT